METILFNYRIPVNLYPRKCDATGVGMFEGFCFDDGDKYFALEEDALTYAKSLGYTDLEEAYQDDRYYWTTWDMDDSEEECYDQWGNLFEKDVNGNWFNDNYAKALEEVDDRLAGGNFHEVFDELGMAMPEQLEGDGWEEKFDEVRLAYVNQYVKQ